jgi:hypothetical protein
MYTPSYQFRALRLHDAFGLYTLARLRADANLSGEAAFFAEAMESLDQRDLERRQAEGLRIERLAARDHARSDLIEGLRCLNYTVKRYARNNLNCPVYLTYFPAGISGAVGGPPESRIAQAQAICEQLESEQIPSIRMHATAIAAALEAARRTQQELREACEAQSAASRLLHQEKLRWIDAYQQVHARLRIHHHRHPVQAEGYFRKRKAWRADENAEWIEEAAGSIQPTVGDEQAGGSVAA